MVKVIGVPVQVTPPAVNTGVTTKVPVNGALVVLVAVKPGIFPVPLAGQPMAGLLFVQLNTVPGIVPVKLTGAVTTVLHTAWLATGATFGTGLTVILKVMLAPVHVVPPNVKVGVTTIVPVIGAPLVFVVTKFRLPIPDAPRPMAVLLFVQL